MANSEKPRIGNIIRDGIAFDPKNWREGAKDVTSLPENVAEFLMLLNARKVDAVLVGGVALLHYVEGRNTQDIDFIVAAKDFERLSEVEILNRDVYFARGRFKTLQIDFLLDANPLFRYVRRTRTTLQAFAEQTVRCATVKGLILLKLYALPSLYRQGEFARVGIYENDVATLLHYYELEIPQLLDELKPYVDTTDWQEINNIVSEIQQRLVRFRRHQIADGT